MIIIERVDSLHLHLGSNNPSPLGQSLLAAFSATLAAERKVNADVQTSGPAATFDATASGEAFNNTFHKVRAEVSRDWWDRIWKMAVESTGNRSGTHALTQPPALGDIWPLQGGRYAGTMPARAGQPAYHLIVAEDVNERVKFGPYDHDVAGAKDHANGAANTAALVAESAEHPAARWATTVRADGHQDFHLPAHNELMLMWINVPELFKKDGWYWSSTQYSPNYAWAQGFENGHSYVNRKRLVFRAVAVRRFVL